MTPNLKMYVGSFAYKSYCEMLLAFSLDWSGEGVAVGQFHYWKISPS